MSSAVMSAVSRFSKDIGPEPGNFVTLMSVMSTSEPDAKSILVICVLNFTMGCDCYLPVAIAVVGLFSLFFAPRVVLALNRLD